MRAIVQDTYGETDVLVLRDVERPTIADDEVLVQVVAAGVHRGTWHLMTGLPYIIRVLGYGLRAPKAPALGDEIAGRVEAVGAAVTRFAVGDAVFGVADGGFAEFVCAKEADLVAKPDGLSFAQAAAIPISGITALQGLRDTGQLTAGQRVLIVGASGGVGTFAVQIAKALGAEVTGVCSGAKADLVRSLGANHVVDYTREAFTELDARYDLILDTAGNRPLAQMRRALTPEGTLVIVGGEQGGRWFGGIHRQLGAALLSPLVRQNLRAVMAKPTQADLEALVGLVEAGTVRPLMGRSYPLAQTTEAIEHLTGGHARGKIVVTVA
jgi:NADPH:quinone reductase-like Zn-dependent oxidoreductase